MNTNQLVIALVIFAVCIEIDAQTTKHPVTTTKKAAAPITLITGTTTKKGLLITSPTTKPITKSATKTTTKPPVKRADTLTTRKTSSKSTTRPPTPLRGSTFSRSLNLFSRSFPLVNLNTTNNDTKATTLNNGGPSSIIGKPLVAQLPVHDAIIIKPLPSIKGKPVAKISEDDDELNSVKKNGHGKQANDNGDETQNNKKNKEGDDNEEKDD